MGSQSLMLGLQLQQFCASRWYKWFDFSSVAAHLHQMSPYGLAGGLGGLSFKPRLEKLRSPSPTTNPALPTPPLNHIPKHHIHKSFKSLQGWWLHHCPGSLLQCPTTLSVKEFSLISNLNLFCATWGCFLLFCPLFHGRRAQSPPVRELWRVRGSPRDSFSPGWAPLSMYPSVLVWNTKKILPEITMTAQHPNSAPKWSPPAVSIWWVRNTCTYWKCRNGAINPGLQSLLVSTSRKFLHS